MRYDFFIAYAAPDRDRAEELYYELCDRKRVCFFDKTSIPLGGRWDHVLTDALDDSRVAVVLVSPRSDAAHYQQDEIVRAIANWRADSSGRAVVPVLLDGASLADVPYGLAVLQGLDGDFADMGRLSFKLHRQFPIEDAPPARARTFRQVGATLRLDRTRQWGALVSAAQRRENTLFLCHGAQDQSVNLFVDRIDHFFSQEVREPRAICRATFGIDGTTPVTGDEWLSRLRLCIECKGPLSACLASMVRQKKQVFFILGEIPLPIDDLTARELAGLREFVTKLLPKLLKESKVQDGVTLLLPFDYFGEQSPRIDDAAAWGWEAHQSGWIHFRPLPPVSLPSWEEITDYLRELRPPFTPDRIESLRVQFDRDTGGRPQTFDMLARWVDRKTLSAGQEPS